MRRALVLATVAVATAACTAVPMPTPVPVVSDAPTEPPVIDGARADGAGTVRLLFGGDVMLGRRVGPVAAAEGPAFFEAIRYVVTSADVASANLESPLTHDPHLADSPNVLEATPDMAALLAGAGFDLMSLANNHATDAGVAGLMDTVEALEAAGLRAIGAGRDAAHSDAAHVVRHHGVDVAFLAYDATRIATSAGEAGPGVATYSRDSAQVAVEAAAVSSDVVVVSLHGGVEYLLETDPILDDIAADLVAWGADVVWGHGAHVPQPITVVEASDGRSAVVATSLGNLVFDQQRAATQTGVLLEVLVSDTGVVAYRTGRATHPQLRPEFDAWDPPAGSAALIDGAWWSLTSASDVVASEAVDVPGFAMGDVTTAGVGDVTGDGVPEYAVSYRHAFRSNPVNRLYPDRDWTDGSGRSAHLGLFDLETLTPIWAAGTMLRPVATIAVCDGSVALAFDSLDSTDIVATGAWIWWDFGFAVPDELPGAGEPACADVDGDGRLDPVIVGR